MTSYYRLQNGRIDGPFAEGELEVMWREGALGATDHLRMVGDRDWVTVRSVLETLELRRGVKTPSRWKKELSALGWVLVLGVLAGAFVVFVRYRDEAPSAGGAANSKGAARVQVQTWMARHAPDHQVMDLSNEFTCDGNRCRLVVVRAQGPEGKPLSTSLICAFAGGGVLWAVDTATYQETLHEQRKDGEAQVIQSQLVTDSVGAAE